MNRRKKVRRAAGQAVLAICLGMAFGCVPVQVNRGTTTQAKIYVLNGPPRPSLNLLRLQVDCAGSQAKDSCNDIATIVAGETTTARVSGVIPAATRISIPGFEVADLVYGRRDDLDIISFTLKAPSTAKPGVYSVYGSVEDKISALTGSLEVVE